MRTIKIDQEFKKLIPPLTSEEYKQLEENLIKEGCRDSLIVWNDTMIDGHNRYEICNRNNIPFKTTEKYFNNREEAIEWIIKNQFGRRNLPNYERAKLALRLEPIVKAKAKENSIESGEKYGKGKPKSDNPIKSINTDAELGKIAGIGKDTIQKVRVIEKEAPEEIKEKARKGEISVNKAFKLTRKPQTDNEASGTRICTICGKEKHISEFYNRDMECKECNRSRKLLKLSRGEARKLNELYPDEEVERYYEEMKNPALRQEETGETEIQDNPIITEYLELINNFKQNIGKFMFMPQVKESKTAMELTEETIKILKNIKSEE